ncbi:MAG: hypothetical protein ABSC63_05310 [Candidatus Binataceae bacterium]
MAVPEATPKPSAYSVTLTIEEKTTTFSCPAGAGTGGACTDGKGLADHCPSGDCECCEYTGSAIGTAGAGPATIWETVDVGGQEEEFGDTYCVPAYGDIEITGSIDHESIAFIGDDCSSTFTPQGFLNGGCILADSSIFTAGGAVAQCGGFYSDSAKTKFKLVGKGLK